MLRAASARNVGGNVPKTVEELKKWGHSCGITEDVVGALVREGFADENMLMDLAGASATEIKGLLGLDTGAKALRLHKELAKLVAQ